MRVALIGAGRMGSAMGGRIVEAGHDLVVFNRTRPRAAEVAQRIGGRVTETAREAAASAEVCVVSLADDAAVTAIIPCRGRPRRRCPAGCSDLRHEHSCPCHRPRLGPTGCAAGRDLARHSRLGKCLER